MLAAGVVFTRPEEKSVLSRTVTLAVTPDQVDTLVAAKSRGPVTLALRGVNDHEIVERPKAKSEVNEEEKAHRLKLEKELEELKLALAKRQVQPPPSPPPPPAAKPPKPELREPRWVYIYRSLEDKKDKDDPAGQYSRKLPMNEESRKLAELRSKPREVEEPPAPGFGGTALTGEEPNVQSVMSRDQ